METMFAKALYDNTAESPDELAFHKGDVVVVLEKTIKGSKGWWKCSLSGQEGLAPANRLRLLSPSESIYQTPRPSETNPTYEVMERSTHMMQSSVPFPWKSESLERNRSLNKMYAVAPTPSKDPNYDIHLPSKKAPRLTTLPNPRMLEHIYDVPVAPEMPVSVCSTIPSKSTHPEKLYDTPPACLRPATVPAGFLYDIPKCSEIAQQKEDSIRPEKECIYDVPPSNKQKEPSLIGLMHPNQKIKNPSDSKYVSKSPDYRCKPGPRPNHSYGLSSLGRNIMLSRELQNREAKTIENKADNGSAVSVSENLRDSTVSNSSSTSSSSRSSWDSLTFGSSSPEPLREITLSPEEATQRLIQLQKRVCQAVPKLMDFVSSGWRGSRHLSQHLPKIRAASEDVANLVTSFLNFALDVRGNAQRLTDFNLQTKLQKQLSIVEDSGLILQTSVNALGGLNWSLDVLAQGLSQSQNPDHLDRFVSVARTLPEDIKRLVSIINANSKLLFRKLSKEPEIAKNTSPQHVRKNESPLRKEGDDDYVQLQTKTDFEKQQQSDAKNNTKLDTKGNESKQASKPEPACPDGTSEQPCKPVISNHCRLYFGAMRKAIAVFVTSLEEQQPPEKFISHSKLVILVGQRLIDTLFTEAQCRQDNQDLLHKSNHLCSLLKQLAVATKKAALHFPDLTAIREAQDFARELSQKAHLFRMSLDI